MYYSHSSYSPDHAPLQLIPHLPEQGVRELLFWVQQDYLPRDRQLERLRQLTDSEIARGISTSNSRLDVIAAALAVRLAELGYPDEAFDTIAERQRDQAQVWELATLARQLPPPLVHRAFALALAASSASWELTIHPEPNANLTLSGTERGEYVLVAFCPLLAAGDWDTAFRLARTITRPLWRVQALAEIAARTPDDITGADEALRSLLRLSLSDDERNRPVDRAQTVREALAATLQIEDREEPTRREVLAQLGPLLAALPPATRYSIWQEVLVWLSAHARQDAISELCRLDVLLVAVGGSEAPVGVLRAIDDVVRWWP